MSETVRVLIADDHPLYSSGLSNLLQSSTGYTVVGTVADGNAVIPAIEKEQPQLVLLDVNMPGKDGLELARLIRQRWPSIGVVLVTMYLPSDLGLEGGLGNADAYVLKNSGSEVVFAAMAAVLAGQSYLDPAVNRSRNNQHSRDNFPSRLKLSSREREILELIIAGRSNKEIANILFLSELTIKTHRKNIMSKMDAHNLAELLRKTS